MTLCQIHYIPYLSNKPLVLILIDQTNRQPMHVNTNTETNKRSKMIQHHHKIVQGTSISMLCLISLLDFSIASFKQ